MQPRVKNSILEFEENESKNRSIKPQKKFFTEVWLISEISFRTFIQNGFVSYMIIYLSEVCMLLLIYPGMRDFYFGFNVLS